MTMRLRFKATAGLQEYHGPGLNLRDGDEAEIFGEIAHRLMNDFPANFGPSGGTATAAIERPPKDKQVRRGQTKVK